MEYTNDFTIALSEKRRAFIHQCENGIYVGEITDEHNLPESAITCKTVGGVMIWLENIEKSRV